MAPTARHGSSPRGGTTGYDRRRFLRTAAGGLLLAPVAGSLLAACGSDDGSGSSTAAGSGDDAGQPGAGPLSALAAIFDVNAYAVTGSEQRLPVALLDGDGAFSTTGPDELVVAVLAGDEQVDEVTVAKHQDQVPIGYYPVRVTFAEPGLYRLRTEVEGTARTADLAVNEPNTVGPVVIGASMPAAATPTVDDPRGVVPICTRVPECPLHGTSLDTALGTGPVALLVSTPAYCQIGICGPVLDVLLELVEAYPGVTFLHAEPFADAEAVGGPQGAQPAPIMTALQMGYEPALWVADAGGTVVDRLDFVFDATEMRAGLDLVA